MSYLQALNAGLLDSADSVTPTLDIVLGYGSTSSKNISLTSAGSLSLASGDITLTSGEIDFGGNGSISASDASGLILTGTGDNTVITLATTTNLTSGPLRFGYTTGTISTSLTTAGGSISYFLTPLTIALTGDSSWRQLYIDSNIIPAGAYMASVFITYNTTDTYAIGNNIYFGISNVGTLSPGTGNQAGSPINTGSVSFCGSITSTGTSTNNVIQFVYYTNMSNITATSIYWTLTRIA